MKTPYTNLNGEKIEIGMLVASRGTAGEVVGYASRNRVRIELRDETGAKIEKLAYAKNCEIL